MPTSRGAEPAALPARGAACGRAAPPGAGRRRHAQHTVRHGAGRRGATEQCGRGPPAPGAAATWPAARCAAAGTCDRRRAVQSRDGGGQPRPARRRRPTRRPRGPAPAPPPRRGRAAPVRSHRPQGRRCAAPPHRRPGNPARPSGHRRMRTERAGGHLGTHRIQPLLRPDEHAGRDQTEPWVLAHEPARSRQGAGRPPRVVVSERDDLGTSLAHPPCPGSRPLVAAQPDHADSGVGGRDGCCRPVARGVVHHDDRRSLRQPAEVVQAGERLIAPVARDHDDGDLRHGGSATRMTAGLPPARVAEAVDSGGQRRGWPPVR